MSRTLVTAALAAALPLALTVPAHADVLRGPEPVGDEIVWQVDAGDPVCGEPTPVPGPDAATGHDVTGLSVRHKPHLVSVTVRYAGAADARSVDLHLRTPGRRWFVDVTPGGDEPAAELMPEITYSQVPVDVDDDGTPDCQAWYGGIGYAPCPTPLGARVSDDGRALTVLVPRRCLGEPRWVRAGGGSFGRVDDLAVVDHWDPTHPDDPADLPSYDPNVHLYGARVLAGPGARVAQKGSPSNRSRVASSETGTRRSFVITRTGLPSGTTAATAY